MAEAPPNNNQERRGGNGRNNRERGVRGPTSALSSFLREKGISVPQNPYARTQPPIQVSDSTSNEVEIESQSALEDSPEPRISSSIQAVEIEVIPEFPAKKKDPSEVPAAKRKRRQPDDEGYLKLIKLCETCKRRFISQNDQLNCHACVSVGARASKAVKRQRKQQQSVVLEVTGRIDGLILPLRDMCIRVISDHLDDIESLGYIDSLTKVKLSRIVSKRRKLTAHNLALFLEEDENELRLFDCTCSRN